LPNLLVELSKEFSVDWLIKRKLFNILKALKEREFLIIETFWKFLINLCFFENFGK